MGEYYERAFNVQPAPNKSLKLTLKTPPIWGG